MNSRHIPDDELPGPMDLERLATDDLLLDRLGSGDAVAEADDAAWLLAHWRAALPAVPHAADQGPPPVPATGGRRRYLSRGVLACATTIVLGAGVVTAAAAQVGPGHPLWPVTQAVYPEHADTERVTASVERTLHEATVAWEHGRYAHARTLLEQARSWIPGIGERAAADRLRTDAERVGALITGIGPSVHRGRQAPTSQDGPSTIVEPDAVSPSALEPVPDSVPSAPAAAPVPEDGRDHTAEPVPESAAPSVANPPPTPSVPVLPPAPAVGGSGPVEVPGPGLATVD